MSPSARKVWIEIKNVSAMLQAAKSRLPQGRCGLKCYSTHCTSRLPWSPSARKVWIEIWLWEAYKTAAMRRLPQGRCGLKYTNKKLVNLTRGHLPQGRCGLKWTCIVQTPRDLTSPSARKVWIEISQYVLSLVYHPVAFRKEGVDWNNSFAERPNKSIASPSARKVWIEIQMVS